ncbi:hypothetical protein [Devosia sp.]|uniref:hypothetical protein n=1 Tax=Devosia sp. TaxID=1871048 RepID=UPI003266DCA5
MVDGDSKSVDQLVSELIATGTMSEETVAELNGYLAASQAGTLDPDDLAYLRAFYARIMDAPVEDVVADEAPQDMRAEFAAMLERAEKAEAEVARLTALLAEKA